MKPLHAAFIPVIFSHWVGWRVSLFYILCLVTFLSLSKLYQGKFSLHKTFVGIIFIFFAAMIFFFFNLIIDNSNSVYIFYFYQFISLFFVVALVLLSRPWNVVEIEKISRFFFWIAFNSIFVEFILVNFLGVSKAYMPAVRYSHAYYTDFMGWAHPFGLTGQFSANGGILLLSFLLLVELRIADAKALVATLIGALLTISGQAILSTVFVMGLLLTGKIRSKLFRIFCFFIVSLSISLVMYSGVFDKLNFHYLTYVLIDKANFYKNLGNLSVFHFLFGTWGIKVADASSEVAFITMIKLFGAVFTALLWGFIWFLVRKSRLGFIWFIGCFLASAHYPTILYIEAQLPLAFLYLSTLRNLEFVSKEVEGAIPNHLVLSRQQA